MQAAASAWNGLAAELESAANSFGSTISALTSGPWIGPSSTAMAAAATPYVAWMGATAQQAQLAASQAQAAAAAYAAAFAATVSPVEIAANRAQLAALVATNFLGQNTPAIAATEALYTEMWAQDAGAMYGYAASSAAATSQVTPFTAAPQTTNLAGLAAQASSTAQSTGASVGTGVQSALSQLTSAFTQALNTLSSPLSALGGSASGATSTITGPSGSILSSSGLSVPGIAGSLIAEYGAMPEWLTISLTSNALGPLMNPDVFLPFMQMNAAAAAQGAAGAAGAAPAFAGMGGGMGGFAGLGQAASVGGLSVPGNWGWAATAPPGLVGALGMPGLPAGAVPLAGDEVAAAAGFPIPFSGLGRAAAVGAGAGAGVAAMKYGPRLKFAARPPAAGYGDEDAPIAPAPPAAAKYPVPATFPTNGHAPPGYQPAVIYVPTNGNAPANV